MNSMQPLRVVIADDGALARQRLEDLLAEASGVELLASVDNGDAAVRAIRELSPDLVFLDIQMPGKNGIAVAQEIGAERMPTTIFVTAYDAYALRAFELAAIDYLLKPFDDDRFAQALRRARQQHELKKVGTIAQPLRELLAGFNTTIAPLRARTAYLERLAVETPGQVRIVAVSDVDYISASGHYAELHIGDKAYVIRERMDHLEERLDPAQFFRIHRSSIVQLNRIASLLRESGGDYTIKLKNDVQLAVSRSRIESLERWIGLDAKR